MSNLSRKKMCRKYNFLFRFAVFIFTNSSTAAKAIKLSTRSILSGDFGVLKDFPLYE